MAPGETHQDDVAVPGSSGIGPLKARKINPKVHKGNEFERIVLKFALDLTSASLIPLGALYIALCLFVSKLSCWRCMEESHPSLGRPAKTRQPPRQQ